MKTRRRARFDFSFVAALALGAGTKSAFSLERFRWKMRPLVVFAPSEASASFLAQRATVNGNRAGFTERDVVVVYVVGDRVRTELGSGTETSASALRRRFGVGPGVFRAILVGKDGGAKLSSGSPLTASTLFKEIDAMPTRRDEVAQRKR